MRKRKGLARQLMFWFGEGARRLRLVYLRLNGVKVGRNVFISFGAKIDTQFGEIEIGDDVHITHGVCILAHDGAIRHTWIAPGVDAGGRVVVGKGAFVGVNAVILKDVILGEHCVVGAGAIVTKSVPPYSLVCGNPARVVRTFCGAPVDRGYLGQDSARGDGREPPGEACPSEDRTPAHAEPKTSNPEDAQREPLG